MTYKVELQLFNKETSTIEEVVRDEFNTGLEAGRYIHSFLDFFCKNYRDRDEDTECPTVMEVLLSSGVYSKTYNLYVLMQKEQN